MKDMAENWASEITLSLRIRAPKYGASRSSRLGSFHGAGTCGRIHHLVQKYIQSASHDEGITKALIIKDGKFRNTRNVYS